MTITRNRFIPSLLGVATVVVASLFAFAGSAGATSCTGTAGSPTAIVGGSLSGAVVFTDDGGDGWCEITGAITADSVDIGAGVTLTHPAEDTDGVDITVTGDLTVTGNIDANEKGCHGPTGYSENGYGQATDSSACTVNTAGYGSAWKSAGYGGASDGVTYGSASVPTFLGSSGSARYSINGGAGGGKVVLDVGGTLLLDGVISVNGGSATAGKVGSGSGGSVYIQTDVFDGGGSISSDGGNAGGTTSDDDSGGGGRIAAYYSSGSFDLSMIGASGGVVSGDAVAGGNGTTFLLDEDDDDLRITSGLQFEDGVDYSRASFAIDSGANMYCEDQATLTISTTGDYTDNGAVWNCAAAITQLDFTVTGELSTSDIDWDFSNTDELNLSADTWTTGGTASTFDVSKTGALVDWELSNDLTLNNMTYTGPQNPGTSSRDGGVLTLDNAIDVTLVDTDLITNAHFDGVTAVALDTTSSIIADTRGCQGGVGSNEPGYGPDFTTGVCTVSTAGYGAAQRHGGSYGGLGGLNTGTVYCTDDADLGNGMANATLTSSGCGDDETPFTFGSGGGAFYGTDGGDGGGKIRLNVDGDITLTGSATLSANGGTGAESSGSGGSIFLTGERFYGDGVIQAAGDGPTDDSGGGGGRVAINIQYDFSSTFDSFSAASTSAAGVGDVTSGADGTYYGYLAVNFLTATTSITSGIAVNRVTVVFNQDIDIVDASAGDGLDNITLSPSSGSCTIDTADYSATNTDTLTLDVTCSTDDTGITIDPVYTTAGTSTVVATGEATEMEDTKTVGGSDGAEPYIKDVAYEDDDGDGKIDRVTFNFTETISGSGSTVVNNNFGMGDDGDFDGLLFPAGASDLVTTDVSNLSITMNESTEEDTYDDSGSLSINFSDGLASIDLEDASGNQNTSTDVITGARVADGAGPVLISSSPEDADEGISTSEEIELVFTEPIDTGGFTYTCCGAATDPGRSGAWTVSDTTYTITPTTDWIEEEVVTIDITTANDTNSNGFVGASPSFADPFSFTIASSSSGRVSSSTSESLTARVEQPNGGTYAGGKDLEISWRVTGDDVSSVLLQYTTDREDSYVDLHEGLPKSGTYLWSVPSEDMEKVKMRVTGLNSAGAALVRDSSDQYFAITKTQETDTAEPTPDPIPIETEGEVMASMETVEGEIIDLYEGHVFKGETLPGVYLVKNGTRYVFPSESVFFSYYSNFDDVIQVKDDQLRALSLSGRVTMAPGRMIKIQSDNRVFQVQQDGTISHIPDEATAISLYGDTWNQQITDINVVFWGDYAVNSVLASQ